MEELMVLVVEEEVDTLVALYRLYLLHQVEIVLLSLL
jgi:hypothetical protein